MLLAGRLANRMTFSNPLFYLKRKGNPRLAPPKSLLFKQGSGLKTDGERDMGVASRARKRWSRPIKIKDGTGQTCLEHCPWVMTMPLNDAFLDGLMLGSLAPAHTSYRQKER
ncbi:predicted protein [Histoplasma capsulatum G186AR]|uniref:Uncharacterized protein n=1 Tax=Ajellomyces capsulatus (strain G186AR / H82 / ATCC MYA-2454 / RMSCC 2432) TaxID=447093 RepID=C0NB97_AJECG|nr:uncharacterized protein HCBG_00393 [Histoplasma capsulatum G186AR]EEH10938.1 predicted protein [Histoplasma capsulatum G186AR]